jgi:hypothetical protein
MSILVLFSFKSQSCLPVLFIFFIVQSKVVSRVRILVFLKFGRVFATPLWTRGIQYCPNAENNVLSLHIYDEVQLDCISKCQGRVFAVMTKCTMSGITFQ